MGDTISRRAAIELIERMKPCHQDADDIAEMIENMPSAQPELIEKAAYIRGFEQGRTQGMIDIKAKEVEQPYLQPTCNQLATDTISRQAVIDTLEKVAELYPWRVPGDGDSYSSYNEAWQDALNRAENEIEALPSAQLDLITKMQNGIKATDANDAYSCGMRNGMRWCISLIDDKDPLYETCPSEHPEVTADYSGNSVNNRATKNSDEVLGKSIINNGCGGTRAAYGTTVVLRTVAALLRVIQDINANKIEENTLFDVTSTKVMPSDTVFPIKECSCCGNRAE